LAGRRFKIFKIIFKIMKKCLEININIKHICPNTLSKIYVSLFWFISEYALCIFDVLPIRYLQLLYMGSQSFCNTCCCYDYRHFYFYTKNILWKMLWKYFCCVDLSKMLECLKSGRGFVFKLSLNKVFIFSPWGVLWRSLKI